MFNLGMPQMGLGRSKTNQVADPSPILGNLFFGSAQNDLFHHGHQFSLSLWQANILGKYAYEIARTGHEMDYLGLQDKPNGIFGGLAMSHAPPKLKLEPEKWNVFERFLRL